MLARVALHAGIAEVPMEARAKDLLHIGHLLLRWSDLRLDPHATVLRIDRVQVGLGLEHNEGVAAAPQLPGIPHLPELVPVGLYIQLLHLRQPGGVAPTFLRQVRVLAMESDIGSNEAVFEHVEDLVPGSAVGQIVTDRHSKYFPDTIKLLLDDGFQSAFVGTVPGEPAEMQGEVPHAGIQGVEPSHEVHLIAEVEHGDDEQDDIQKAERPEHVEGIVPERRLPCELVDGMGLENRLQHRGQLALALHIEEHARRNNGGGKHLELEAEEQREAWAHDVVLADVQRARVIPHGIAFTFHLPIAHLALQPRKEAVADCLGAALESFVRVLRGVLRQIRGRHRIGDEALVQ
mmetsp:Transcript_118369/g.339752  ORF Transcript_118369/g.339752 Transcript_118369/m.339752 type:complete len:348 (-) Transcript_118369:447-1490(-)